MRSKAWATSNRQEANDEFSDRRGECGRGGGLERGLDRGADEGGGAAEEEVGGGAGEVQRRGAARGGAEAGDAAQPAAEAAARAQGPPGQGEWGSCFGVLFLMRNLIESFFKICVQYIHRFVFIEQPRYNMLTFE